MVVLRTEIILRNYISEKSPIAIVTHLDQDLGVGAIACVNNVKNPVLLARWFFLPNLIIFVNSISVVVSLPQQCSTGKVEVGCLPPNNSFRHFHFCPMVCAKVCIMGLKSVKKFII